MKAGDIAALMSAGFAKPTGPEDSAFHTGQIVSWDELSGVNSVLVNGVILSNLKIIQSGIGLTYSVNDVVVIMRKQTQYFIMGKVADPGAGLSNQIKAAAVTANQTTATTTFTDLATVGPQVTVTIGSSRRCLVIVDCRITCTTAGQAAQYVGGAMGFAVSGASSIAAGNGALNVQFYSGPTAPNIGWNQAVSHTVVLDSSNGLNAGSNTFTAKYYSQTASPICGFEARNIVVIPF